MNQVDQKRLAQIDDLLNPPVLDAQIARAGVGRFLAPSMPLFSEDDMRFLRRLFGDEKMEHDDLRGRVRRALAALDAVIVAPPKQQTRARLIAVRDLMAAI